MNEFVNIKRSWQAITCHYVSQFKYLGHIIKHSCCDDFDVNRQLRTLVCENVLLRRFSYCSRQVKLNLFKAYRICFYDIALWRNVHSYVISKLSLAYVKCLKVFFGFPRYYSVTALIMQLGV